MKIKLRDIYQDKLTKIFRVINQDFDNELDFEIIPTEFETIPDEVGYFIIRALEVKKKKINECFMDINTPERISDIVIKKRFLRNIKISEYYNYEGTVIPAVASNCFGVYDLYYSKENPLIGIDVLINGLEKGLNKEIVYGDLGYILRDENRNEEAIEAFKKSIEHGSNNPYSYLELSHLYERLGDTKMKEEYYNKYIENGGKIINIS
ncbi:MAG: tetratricopeptide repeat protein [Flavobacteriia bacterium]|nr:tetratricopeptide repeat protein [Flavobacteriia bacterium]